MRALPELKAGQDWCCGDCGSGIVKNPKRIDFEYSREEFPDGRVISMTIPKYVAPCCGEEVMLWDEAKQDCVPWEYVDTTAHEAEALGDKVLTRCAAGRDGECGHAQCPQLRDGEPAKSGRHCPLDNEGIE